MKELEFSHHVSQIPQGQQLPEYNRSVTAEISHIPDYQSAVSNYASATNWMSAIGSEVATRASNAIATKLGAEAGKNPKEGHLGLSLTEFDKVYEESYTRQAQATLGLQAQTLISKANLEVAASPSINADMILKSQEQVKLGLSRIFSLAPESVRGQMEYQYGGVMLNQNEHLVSRMLKQQQEDRRNTLDLSTKVNNQNAFSLALSGAGGVDENTGDSKSGLAAVKAVEDHYASAVATRDATPLEAKVAIDTARQSYLSGKYSRLAEFAEQSGKLPGFYKELGDPENPETTDISLTDRKAVLDNVVAHMNERAALNMQDQQLKMAEFQVKLAENPDQITGTELAQLQSQLTPIQGQKVKLDFIQALNKRKKDDTQSNILISDWGNPDLHARADKEVQNKTFDKLTDKAVAQSNESGKMPISRDEAQLQVAASAGAPIPVFTKGLQLKLSSGNPVQMDAAAQQMHALYQRGAGHALAGLTEQDKAMYETMESLRSSLNPTEAAREAVNKIYNQDPAMFKANQQKWSDYLSANSKGISNSDFALKNFQLSKTDFINPSVAQVYGTDILNKYASNYQILSGDEKTAKAMTQRYVDENYGETGVNGGSNVTLHPIEKVLGYSDNRVVPAIQTDIINQLNSSFLPTKKAYDEGKSNEYWTTEPLSDQTHGIFSTTYDPVKLKRHTKVNGKEKVDTFDAVVQGNAWDWDVSVYSPQSGLRSLYQIAPFMGYIQYKPNKKAIQEHYLKVHHAPPSHTQDTTKFFNF